MKLKASLSLFASSKANLFLPQVHSFIHSFNLFSWHHHVLCLWLKFINLTNRAMKPYKCVHWYRTSKNPKKQQAIQPSDFLLMILTLIEIWRKRRLRKKISMKTPKRERMAKNLFITLFEGKILLKNRLWKGSFWRWRASIPLPIACKAIALPFELHPL